MSRFCSWLVHERRLVVAWTHLLPERIRTPLFGALFLAASAALACVPEVIPCSEWAFPGFASFYRWPRFSAGAAIFFAGQCLTGYLFNTVGVHGPGIGHCHTRLRGKAAVICVYFTVLYLLGAIFVLNGPCLQDGEQGTVAGMTFTSALHDRLLWSILFRWLAFSVPQWLGLHWTLMDRIQGLGDIVLTPAWIRKWRRKQWTAVAIGVSIAFAATVYNLYLLQTIDRLHWYALGLLTLAVCFFGFAWAVSGHYRLHFHHYCFAAFAAFFPVHESPFSTVAQALFLFIGMEGLCTWGPDPLFYPLTAEEKTQSRRATQSSTQIVVVAGVPGGTVSSSEDLPASSESNAVQGACSMADWASPSTAHGRNSVHLAHSRVVVVASPMLADLPADGVATPLQIVGFPDRKAQPLLPTAAPSVADEAAISELR
jgi:hypothetical protein